jgi:thiol-disulfide isomerase/thioredoxin
MKKLRRLPFLLIAAFVAIALLILSVSLSNNAIKKGQSERFQLNILDEIINATNNENPIINDSLKGKTIVINVWATWCKPCLQEIPKLNQLVEDFKSEEVVFIALNREGEEKEKETMKAKDIQFDYDLHFDQSKLIDLLYSFKLENEGTGIPLNIVINKSGQPAFYYMGNQPDKLEEVREYLSKMNKTTVRLL